MLFLQQWRRNNYSLALCLSKMQALWKQLTSHLNGHLNLPHLTPQSDIFSFSDTSNKDYLIANQYERPKSSGL